MPRPKQVPQTADKLARLAAPPPYTAAQLDYAAQCFERDGDAAVIKAALAVLAAGEYPRLRPLLLARFRHCAGDPPRRDQGGGIRSLILHTLRPLAQHDDIPLLEQAASTYEFLFGEAAGDLRAAALLTLNEVDDRLASYHCTRLLIDPHTSPMSGEPAATAVRILAAQGQYLPLYGYLIREHGGVADVLAECLRNMTPLPASLLPPLVERYLASEDEIVLLGLFDLLLARPDRADYRNHLLEFLRDTTLYNSYRYLITAIVASREAPFIAALAHLQATERNREKRALLEEALQLR
jgi:hypothetical protein